METMSNGIKTQIEEREVIKKKMKYLEKERKKKMSAKKNSIRTKQKVFW